jgi:hypothetical protein
MESDIQNSRLGYKNIEVVARKMTKSPVHGLGRNRNHRPDRSPFHPAAANINMKGKKTKKMSCWCCVCVDFREEMMQKEHDKEMKQIGDE